MKLRLREADDRKTFSLDLPLRNIAYSPFAIFQYMGEAEKLGDTNFYKKGCTIS